MHSWTLLSFNTSASFRKTHLVSIKGAGNSHLSSWMWQAWPPGSTFTNNHNIHRNQPQAFRSSVEVLVSLTTDIWSCCWIFLFLDKKSTDLSKSPKIVTQNGKWSLSVLREFAGTSSDSVSGNYSEKLTSYEFTVFYRVCECLQSTKTLTAVYTASFQS